MKIIFPNLVGNIDIYMDVLRAICGETHGKSMIDIGCAFAPNTPKLGFEKRLYIDVIDRKLDHPEEQQFFKVKNILELDLRLRFDVAIASDMIEHLYDMQGKNLIDIMQIISHKQIIFTPLGEIFKLHTPTADDPEAHHSLWTPDDFPGWATIVFPKYHEQWNGGAFFAFFAGVNTQVEFDRVLSLIAEMSWNEDMFATW